MNKIVQICVAVIIALIMNVSHVQAEKKAMSKEFQKIATRVTQIDSGERNIIYKKNKNAYVIGYDGFGCMGYEEDEEKKEIRLKPNRIGKKVGNVYCSNDLVAYTKQGKVYFCGDGYGGEFYNYFDNYFTPTQFVPLQSPKKVKNIWLSEGNLAYGHKNNLYLSGLLVNPPDQSAHFKPKCILKNKLNTVKDISVSSHFVIVHYKNGKADIMGDNDDNRCIRDKEDWEYYDLTPIKQFRSGVKKYVVGKENVGAIKENGDFYIWGSNKNGFLCKTSLKKALYKPQLVLRNVKAVSMKYNHVLALKKDGTVWAWGRNNKNAINRSKKKVITKPVKIASNVKKITSGLGFSVIVKNNGTAYWKGTMS